MIDRIVEKFVDLLVVVLESPRLCLTTIYFQIIKKRNLETNMIGRTILRNGSYNLKLSILKRGKLPLLLLPILNI